MGSASSRLKLVRRVNMKNRKGKKGKERKGKERKGRETSGER
jgi:hypothetical protein